jgi:hypothetical protein
MKMYHAWRDEKYNVLAISVGKSTDRCKDNIEMYLREISLDSSSGPKVSKSIPF